MEPVLREVVGLFQPLLSEQGVKVEIRVDPADCQASFDRQRVEQILTNLLTNALKYSKPCGLVEIAARRLPVDPSGGRRFVEISVSDQGQGVAPEDRERIFDRYVQLGNDSHAGGLGLGLAICRRLVAAHGGSIRVDEGENGGSRFSFTLPETHDEPKAESTRGDR